MLFKFFFSRIVFTIKRYPYPLNPILFDKYSKRSYHEWFDRQIYKCPYWASLFVKRKPEYIQNEWPQIKHEIVSCVKETTWYIRNISGLSKKASLVSKERVFLTFLSAMLQMEDMMRIVKGKEQNRVEHNLLDESTYISNGNITYSPRQRNIFKRTFPCNSYNQD